MHPLSHLLLAAACHDLCQRWPIVWAARDPKPKEVLNQFSAVWEVFGWRCQGTRGWCPRVLDLLLPTCSFIRLSNGDAAIGVVAGPGGPCAEVLFAGCTDDAGADVKAVFA
eukprot:3039283-Karenia_brevis.AAC.1